MIGLIRRRLASYAWPGVSVPIPIRVPDDPWTWCQIGQDSLIELRLPKIDCGQATRTALAQVFCDELGLPTSSIQVAHASTAFGFPGNLTLSGGSTSVATLAPTLQRMGALVRAALLTAASSRLNVPPSELRLETDSCVHPDTNARVRFVDIRDEAKERPTNSSTSISSSPHLHSGPAVRDDLDDLLTGATRFVSDTTLPGMLHGRSIHPPRHGARVRSVTGLDEARAVPGVVKVLRRRHGVDLIAETPSALQRAAQHLTIEWRGGASQSSSDIESRVRVDESKAGVMIEGKRGSEQPTGLRREYRTAPIAALPFEAPVAIVDASTKPILVLASVQSLKMVRAAVARELRVRSRSVEVRSSAVGGSFGRKHGSLADPATDAARMSRIARAPVKVQWSWSDDLQWGPVRPPSHHVMTGTHDGHKITNWRHQFAVADSSTTVKAVQTVAQLTGVDIWSVMGAPLLYDIEARSLEFQRAPVDVLTAAFRAPGIGINCFAVESFMDELAIDAGADPLQYRLDHLSEHIELQRRLAHVLRTAAQRSSWPDLGGKGIGRGIACCAYGDCVAAVVAEVDVNDDVRVNRLWVAIDAGRIVNPSGAQAQVIGAAIMGTSWALREEVLFSDGRVDIATVDTYRVLRASEAPTVDVEFVPSDEWRTGLGEIPAGPVAPAIANAIAHAGGPRLRRLPLLSPSRQS